MNPYCHGLRSSKLPADEHAKLSKTAMNNPTVGRSAEDNSVCPLTNTYHEWLVKRDFRETGTEEVRFERQVSDNPTSQPPAGAAPIT
jgi:hypothetical protein